MERLILGCLVGVGIVVAVFLAGYWLVIRVGGPPEQQVVTKITVADAEALRNNDGSEATQVVIDGHTYAILSREGNTLDVLEVPPQ